MLSEHAYIICSTPRSGSSLLSFGLTGTNQAGNPAEWFGLLSLREEVLFNRRYEIVDYRKFLQRMIAISSTPNGVFGAKVHAFQTGMLLRRLEDHYGRPFNSLHEAFDVAFPGLRYIYITRTDAVKQAVSFYRAIMSGAWHSGQKPDSAIFFDQYGIKKSLVDIERSKEYWEGYFAAHGIVPLRIEYETLVSHYEDELRRALTYLGLDPSVPLPSPRTARQADELSLAWEQEFIAREAEDPIALPPRQSAWAPF